MLFDFHFHDSPAAIWTILSVPVEWNEEPSGVHRRHTRKEASEKCRFPRHPGFRKKGQVAGTSKNVSSNGKSANITLGGSPYRSNAALARRDARTPVQDRGGVSASRGEKGLEVGSVFPRSLPAGCRQRGARSQTLRVGNRRPAILFFRCSRIFLNFCESRSRSGSIGRTIRHKH